MTTEHKELVENVKSSIITFNKIDLSCSDENIADKFANNIVRTCRQHLEAEIREELLQELRISINKLPREYLVDSKTAIRCSALEMLLLGAVNKALRTKDE